MKHLSTLLTPVLAILLITGLLSGCLESKPKQRAVYLLMDTSGTYTRELAKARAVIHYLLATLESGDTIAVGRIDSRSFSETDIIAKAHFEPRTSEMNRQKRAFKAEFEHFIENDLSASTHTDITGGVLVAAEFLRESQAQQQTLYLFSDLEEDLTQGLVRDFPLTLGGIEVIALNVTKLRSDNRDPRNYQRRLEHWRTRVVDGGGQWRVINDLDRLEKLH